MGARGAHVSGRYITPPPEKVARPTTPEGKAALLAREACEKAAEAMAWLELPPSPVHQLNAQDAFDACEHLVNRARRLLPKIDAAKPGDVKVRA
jgi:hypothetical protein